MTQLTAAQQRAVAAAWADVAFSNVTANFSVADIQAAAAAVDNALDTTLNAAVIAVGGTTTVANGMAAVMPAPFSSASAAQKGLLVCYVIMKRTGII